MANWERKSSYLLREIVKFRTYIDCLQSAQVQKKKIYAARAVEAAEKEQQANGLDNEAYKAQAHHDDRNEVSV
jgi:hypothetical protein